MRQNIKGGLHGKDSKLAINWPLSITDMSGRDNDHKFVDLNFEGIQL
jgi:dTDP-4-dehydrorhamnose 3,5-epimerase